MAITRQMFSRDERKRSRKDTLQMFFIYTKLEYSMKIYQNTMLYFSTQKLFSVLKKAVYLWKLLSLHNA